MEAPQVRGVEEPLLPEPLRVEGRITQGQGALEAQKGCHPRLHKAARIRGLGVCAEISNQGGALRGACLAGGDEDGASCLERSLGGRLRAVPEAATDSLLTQVPRSSALGSSLAGCCIERCSS